ncbi:hypothetical protein Esi_0207_0002 [Ectocarpus siliculosus]|uniref:Uncharacterized protein n=1 Tax=Ectocarpus siliculosus TaxID=2880 RepID=D7FQP6_ECTSI|nr:hypothetical protein Esi_0207_0002 [Ectocarpus siliculosus]|eukprot:CBJ49153.1 hypothetical protein Esi_0207_0002 [Ectocarpus siliculosus]
MEMPELQVGKREAIPSWMGMMMVAGRRRGVAHNLRLLLEKGLIPLQQLLPKPDVGGVQLAPDAWGYATWVYSCYVNSCLQ